MTCSRLAADLAQIAPAFRFEEVYLLPGEEHRARIYPLRRPSVSDSLDETFVTANGDRCP